MGWFSSGKSWTNQAKSEPNRSGIFGSRTWTNTANGKYKRCPPVGDCKVKKTLMASAQEQRLWGVRTKKEVKQAKALAAKIARQQRAGRQQSRWPYAGSYKPAKQERSRGKGK